MSSLYGSGLYGAGLYGYGAGVPAPVAGLPVVTVEAAFGNAPGDATYTWTDISHYARGLNYSRGKQAELNEVQAGTGTIILRDETRRFDPSNAASPYFPDVLPLVPIRATATIGTTTYPLFQHYVERWPQHRIGPNYAERQLTSVDGFELLNQALFRPTDASLTTTFGGNADLTFTARTPGTGGNSISVRYEVRSWSTPNSNVIGNDIAVRVNGTSDTASQVRTNLLANTEAMGLISCELAPGSSGAGVVPEMTTTFLTGGALGGFALESSGTRIGNCLDAAGWPAVLRAISAGRSNVAAVTFTENSSSSVLQEILQAAGEQGEQGLFFIDGRGYAVFLDRWALITSPYTTSVATFSDTPASNEYRYQDITPSYDKDQIINEWVGTREGGLTQRVTDTTSQNSYLRRSRSITSTLTTDNEVLDILQWRLSQFKDPQNRIESIKVMPGADTALWHILLGLELGDRITVKEHPPGGGAATIRDYNVQSLNATFPPGTGTNVSFQLGLWPADTNNWFILDDAVFGRLDFNKLGA